jgi:hypothetical protein
MGVGRSIRGNSDAGDAVGPASAVVGTGGSSMVAGPTVGSVGSGRRVIPTLVGWAGRGLRVTGEGRGGRKASASSGLASETNGSGQGVGGWRGALSAGRAEAAAWVAVGAVKPTAPLDVLLLRAAGACASAGMPMLAARAADLANVALRRMSASADGHGGRHSSRRLPAAYRRAGAA